MKLLTSKVLAALLPVIVVSAAWIVWDLKHVPYLDEIKDQGAVLAEQFDTLDRKINSGEITQHEAINRLKTAMEAIQKADEEIMATIKVAMNFLFLAIMLGVVTGTSMIIFLELKEATKDKKS